MMGFCYSMYLSMYKYQNPIFGSDPMMGFGYNMYLTVFMNWDSNLGFSYNLYVIILGPHDAVLLQYVSNYV